MADSQKISLEIRKKFLNFFVSNNHIEIPSSPLTPENDATLLFVNSGMVQFKKTILLVTKLQKTKMLLLSKNV